ncbi:HAD family hydrolase [Ruminococcus sp.]|uniref:HAD family hydrolase n=1 Tax=Ruminococcus sp. TaxID=41978 RepID=UPI00258DD765|nr:HAD family hydrolase [Ruminococcus sp.]
MKYIYKERLRAGTVELMNYIQSEGIELWIYTTSFRSERYIRGLFRCYGIKPDLVVNGQRHADEVQKGHAEGMPSKYPSKYRIDLHIDDDISVAQNGRTYGFRVFTVGEQDDEWAEKIKAEIAKIRNRNEKQ